MSESTGAAVEQETKDPAAAAPDVPEGKDAPAAEEKPALVPAPAPAAEEKPAPPAEPSATPAAEEKPAAPAEPPAVLPEAEKPAEEKPAEEKPPEEKPAGEMPPEEKPVEPKPVEERPAEEKPAEPKPPEEKPAEETPPEEKPAPKPPPVIAGTQALVRLGQGRRAHHPWAPTSSTAAASHLGDKLVPCSRGSTAVASTRSSTTSRRRQRWDVVVENPDGQRAVRERAVRFAEPPAIPPRSCPRRPSPPAAAPTVRILGKCFDPGVRRALRRGASGERRPRAATPRARGP